MAALTLHPQRCGTLWETSQATPWALGRLQTSPRALDQTLKSSRAISLVTSQVT